MRYYIIQNILIKKLLDERSTDDQNEQIKRVNEQLQRLLDSKNQVITDLQYKVKVSEERNKSRVINKSSNIAVEEELDISRNALKQVMKLSNIERNKAEKLDSHISVLS
jgi:hypothetical protein